MADSPGFKIIEDVAQNERGATRLTTSHLDPGVNLESKGRV